MRFEASPYHDTMAFKKVTLPIGDFYMLDFFVIAEINEGVHIGTEACQEILIALVAHYGEDLKIGFISNRIHSFSIDIRLWVKYNTDFDFIFATAIVFYDDLNFNMATLEKKLSNYSTKRCHNLEQAIDWMSHLREFKSFTAPNSTKA